jgi:hypothetical protein
VLVLRNKSDIRIKDTALITQGDKLRFFRPQIDMDDIMKFDKEKAILKRMI